MAAIVEPPLSAMSTTTMDPVVAQQRRRQESVEIIDVDSLDDEVALRHAGSQPPPPSPVPRPLGRRRHATIGVMDPDTILVLDSDEEEERLIPGISITNGRPANRSRLISPPPPHAHRPSPVPPVPPVPSRYAGQTSLPMRPPVRAIARPFDFEANRHARYPAAAAAHFRRFGSPPLHAAAHSHHVPSMGLGGALISSYREAQHQNAHHQNHNHHHHPQPGLLARAGAAASGFANRLSRNLAQYRNWGSGDNGPAGDFDGTHRRHHHDHHHNHDHLPPDTSDDDALARLLVETEMQELFGRHLLRHFVRDQQPQAMIYQPAYTHPSPVESGFTHDFGAELTPTSPHRRRHYGPIVIDDDGMEIGSSSAMRRASSPMSIKSSNVLVCARCLEPLVLSAGLIGENAERRRVWGLRCGHLIDGKCLKEIGQPFGDPSDEESIVKTEAKKRGKSRRAFPAKGKGKGKAKAIDEEPEATPEQGIGTGTAAAATLTPSTYGDNSIRSRLRSSRMSSILSIPSSPSSPEVTRRKRARKPKIEGEYRYLCPVVGCGSIHVSVKADGEWRPERDEDRKKPSGRRSIKFPNDLVADGEGGIDVRGRGAIPVFV